MPLVLCIITQIRADIYAYKLIMKLHTLLLNLYYIFVLFGNGWQLKNFITLVSFL